MKSLLEKLEEIVLNDNQFEVLSLDETDFITEILMDLEECPPGVTYLFPKNKKERVREIHDRIHEQEKQCK